MTIIKIFKTISAYTLIIVLSIVNGYSQFNAEAKIFMNTINSLRKELKRDSINANPKIQVSLEKIVENRKMLNNKDSIREILRNNKIYDYIIEYFEIQVDDLNIIKQAKIQSEYPELYEVLQDKDYNQFGCNIIKKRNTKYELQLLFTKHYIDFDEELLVVGSLSYGQDPKYVEHTFEIKGASMLHEINYKTYADVFNLQKPISEGNIKLDKSNKFFLEIDIKPNLDVITIADKSNNIIAVRKINYWRASHEK